MLIKILKNKGRLHFNALFDTVQKNSPKITRTTLSRHLSKLRTTGIVHRDPLNIGKKRYYFLSADSEIELLISEERNLFPNKRSQRNYKKERLKNDIRLVLIRLAVISYVKYLDPKMNHGPGTIFLPMDEFGNAYTYSFSLEDARIIPNPIPEKLAHIPIESIPQAQGVLFTDLQRPPKRMSELGNLYSHIPLSNKELKRCISILTTGSEPGLVARVEHGTNRYRIITDHGFYPVLTDYVRDWLYLLLLLMSRLECIWKYVRKETVEEIKCYDRIFGSSRRTIILLSARENRKSLRSKRGSRRYNLFKQERISVMMYDSKIEEKLRSLRMNEKYREFEDRHPFLTKILREEIDQIYEMSSRKGKRSFSD